MVDHVSILARLVGRALRSWKVFRQRDYEFQSSPGWLAGRCAIASSAILSFLSFNPRPAGWPGAAVA